MTHDVQLSAMMCNCTNFTYKINALGPRVLRPRKLRTLGFASRRPEAKAGLRESLIVNQSLAGFRSKA